MTYADPVAKRLAARERQRRRRARLKAEASRRQSADVVPHPAVVDDPVTALATWARERLVVPPGHPLAGQPMELPAFAEKFLRSSWTAHESALSMARKNGKSAIAAVVALGYLVGPLQQSGWRGAVASISKEKASELRGQVAAIAEASKLPVQVRRSPYPGQIISSTGSLETLSADRKAGHASSFDLVIVDETGLMPERARELLAGLRSSVSAKNGRIMHISVRGDSPLFLEIIQNPAVNSTIFAADDDCSLDDEGAWRAANPGLGTIKQIEYMKNEVERIAAVPADEPSFRAYDLNLALSPSKEMICSPDDVRACFEIEPPARQGPCYLGFDFGEAASGTAAAAIWPDTGRMETWLAFGDTPSLLNRQRADDAPYVEMERRGELRTYMGRIVPIAEFLADVRDDLGDTEVAAAAADSYKRAEAMDFLERSGVGWPVEFRRVGAGKDGGRDVRAFQRLIHTKRLRMTASLSLSSAIAKSTLRRDANGNPGIERGTFRGRIDVLSAAVIAAGLAEPAFDREEDTGWLVRIS